MKLRYERGALADLDEIFAYIVADNREAAGRLVARIEEVATRIAASPHIGGKTLKSGFLRFPVGKYLIVYEVGNDEVVRSLRPALCATAFVGRGAIVA
jgi:plasmid stabilization system protein ParE